MHQVSRHRETDKYPASGSKCRQRKVAGSRFRQEPVTFPSKVWEAPQSVGGCLLEKPERWQWSAKVDIKGQEILLRASWKGWRWSHRSCRRIHLSRRRRVRRSCSQESCQRKCYQEITQTKCNCNRQNCCSQEINRRSCKIRSCPQRRFQRGNYPNYKSSVVDLSTSYAARREEEPAGEFENFGRWSFLATSLNLIDIQLANCANNKTKSPKLVAVVQCARMCKGVVVAKYLCKNVPRALLFPIKHNFFLASVAFLVDHIFEISPPPWAFEQPSNAINQIIDQWSSCCARFFISLYKKYLRKGLQWNKLCKKQFWLKCAKSTCSQFWRSPALTCSN